jgi:O-antigen ligase
MNNSTNSMSKWYSSYLAVFLLIIILLPKLTALMLVVFIPLAVVGMRKGYFTFRFNWVSLSFIILYCYYLVYCSFTRHPDMAINYLEYKLSFIIFPIITSFVPAKVDLKFPVFGFLTGSLVLFFMNLGHSFMLYSSGEPVLSAFMTTSFSFYHHPSYAASYFIVSLFLIRYAYKHSFRWITYKFSILLSFVFVLGVFLCFSLAGMLYFFGATAVVMFVFVYKKWGPKRAYLIGLLTLVFIGAAFQFVPKMKAELNEAKIPFIEYVSNPNDFICKKQHPYTNSERRLIMWTISYNVLKEYPFGVGTGNVDEVLGRNLNDFGHKEIADEKLNPHNQFLQTGVELGWLGLIVLLIPFVIAVYYSKKYNNQLILLLVSLLFFNMLFESMLQRQSGIVFFTFSICFLVMLSKNKLITVAEQNNNN